VTNLNDPALDYRLAPARITAVQTASDAHVGANGLRPVDGPFGDFSDNDGYVAAAKRAAVPGCEGKWAIHPSQITLANQVISQSDAEMEKANRILESMTQAATEGKGAVSLDGRLIDYASIRQAEVLVEKTSQIANN
jgi:malyl-CoA/(S)-citramalyl-CoA lyase